MDIIVNEQTKSCYGEPNKCQRNQLCCNWGCCEHLAFQFYQQWYYWMLVILMFMLCSGGGWWYRYWISARCPDINHTQGLARTEMGHAPLSSDPTLITQFPFNRALHRNCMRVSYDPGRHTILMHQLLKGPSGMIQPPPSYALSVGDPSAIVSGAMPAVGAFGSGCTYFQLYGPPPSYESVVGQISTVPSVASSSNSELTFTPAISITDQNQPLSARSEAVSTSSCSEPVNAAVNQTTETLTTSSHMVPNRQSEVHVVDVSSSGACTSQPDSSVSCEINSDCLRHS